MSYWNKDVLVLGCGNILFGDDGFGPGVVEYFLQHKKIPAGAAVIDAGLGVREILFNVVLSEKRPRKIIIVDAVDAGREPGEIFELDISAIPDKKIDDFSMHQLPTSNLLKDLKENCGVEVTILSTQVQHIPEEIHPGLSKVVEETIPEVCERIIRAITPGT
jgi:coenzyme F420 hydrogenase subunit delta